MSSGVAAAAATPLLTPLSVRRAAARGPLLKSYLNSGILTSIGLFIVREGFELMTMASLKHSERQEKQMNLGNFNLGNIDFGQITQVLSSASLAIG